MPVDKFGQPADLHHNKISELKTDFNKNISTLKENLFGIIRVTLKGISVQPTGQFNLSNGQEFYKIPFHSGFIEHIYIFPFYTKIYINDQHISKQEILKYPLNFDDSITLKIGPTTEYNQTTFVELIIKYPIQHEIVKKTKS